METLQSSDVTNLLRGSQLGRRLASKSTASSGCSQQPSDSSDDEFIFNDSEYDSESDYISSDYNDSDEDMEREVQDLIRDTDSIGDISSSTFLQEVLESLRSINKGSINWNIIDVNDLVKDYFQKPDACLKMTHDHLNAISNLITSHTGVKVFNHSDNKSTKINKLFENIRTASSKLVPTPNVGRKTISSLLDLCKRIFLQIYPQDYLQFVLMKVIYEDSMMKWESEGSIPLNLEISQGPATHLHIAATHIQESVNREINLSTDVLILDIIWQICAVKSVDMDTHFVKLMPSKESQRVITLSYPNQYWRTN